MPAQQAAIGRAQPLPASGPTMPGSLPGRLLQVARNYQRVLADHPRNAGALVGMSLVALASRQTEAAVRMAQAAVSADPAMGAAWVALGQALKTSQRTAEAGAAYSEALRLDGMDTLARMGLAELKIAMERPEEAMREYEFVLRRNPALVAAHLGMGHAFRACAGMPRRCSDTKMRCCFSPGSRKPSLPPVSCWRGSIAHGRRRRVTAVPSSCSPISPLPG